MPQQLVQAGMAAALGQVENLSGNRSGRLFRPRDGHAKNPYLSASVHHRAGAQARRDVGDNGEVIGAGARVEIEIAADQCRAGPAIDAVEPQQRPARGKGAVARVGGKLARERRAHRAGPEPVIEVADDDRGHGALSGNAEQGLRLAAPLANAQAEMGRDEAYRAERGLDLRLDGAPRLPLGKGNVVDFARRDRPAADQHLTVIAVRRGDRFCPDAVAAERVLQIDEGVARGLAPGIDLLQGNDVGVPALDQRDNAGEIEPRIAPQRAVNVPGHHAHGRGAFLPQSRSLHSFETSTCRPMDTAIHPTTAARRSATSAGVGWIRMRKIWWPSTESTISPGSIPRTVPAT